MTAYYNEVDPFCCDVLRARIADGSLPPGDVDERDIREVSADDCREYDQIHLFAGIGGFGYAARLAGVPDGFGILTGGFPCQPWSVAGKRGGSTDDRHLWPEMLRLVRALRPQRVLGENVPGLDDAEYMALDGVLSDLEGVGYAGAPIEIPACAAGARHIRTRLWVMAYPECDSLQGRQDEAAGGEAESGAEQLAGLVQPCPWPTVSSARDDGTGYGVPQGIHRNKALGNAIVPQVAAQIIQAMKEVT